MDMKSLPAIVLTILVFSVVVVTSDPQINQLNIGCSRYNVTNLSIFLGNLNTTFSDLRSQLSNGSNRFATAQRPREPDPVYAMVQCRNYLNSSDCLQCFDAAVAGIRNCSIVNGARVIYDGCFLRYESSAFFDQTTLEGNAGFCSNRTVSQGSAFTATVDQLLSDLLVATPKINGYFAATNRQLGNTSVYAIAQGSCSSVPAQGFNPCASKCDTNT